MTTILQDDVNGETYTEYELKAEGMTDREGRPRLDRAGVLIGGVLHANFDYHSKHTDYDMLRDKLHYFVDEAVDTWEEAAEAEADSASDAADEPEHETETGTGNPVE